MFPMLANL